MRKETVKLIDIAAGTGYLGVLLADAYERRTHWTAWTYASDFSAGIVATMKKRFEEKRLATSRVKEHIRCKWCRHATIKHFIHAYGCTGAIYFVRDQQNLLPNYLRILRPGERTCKLVHFFNFVQFTITEFKTFWVMYQYANPWERFYALSNTTNGRWKCIEKIMQWNESVQANVERCVYNQ